MTSLQDPDGFLASAHRLACRAAVAVLLALNLAGGLYRYAHPSGAGDHLLWDLHGAIRSTRACGNDPLAAAASGLPCDRPAPYLPGGFVLFPWIGSLPWNAVVAGWFLLAIPLTIWICRRTVAHLTHGYDSPSPRAQTLIVVSLLAFKGTSLALYAGNPSLITTWLLGGFALLELLRPRHWQWPAAICLALAATKPNMAAPFFFYLLLTGDLRVLLLTVATTAAIHIPAAFAVAGPVRHLQFLLSGVDTMEAHSGNRVDLLGASGRVDLRPMLAAAGMPPAAVTALALSLFAAASGALLAWRRRLGDRLLMLNANVVFFALLYHRDYDVLLLQLIALPLIWKHRRRFGLTAALLALPAVLPVQLIHSLGMQRMPEHAQVWNVAGTSMIVSVLGITAWINWCELSPRRRGGVVQGAA